MSLGDPRVPSTSCGGRDKSFISPHSAIYLESKLAVGGRWGEVGDERRAGGRLPGLGLGGASGLAGSDWTHRPQICYNILVLCPPAGAVRSSTSCRQTELVQLLLRP